MFNKDIYANIKGMNLDYKAIGGLGLEKPKASAKYTFGAGTKKGVQITREDLSKLP